MWWACCLIGWALWVLVSLEWLWYAIREAPLEEFPGQYGMVD